jgi:hypothetical protein
LEIEMRARMLGALLSLLAGYSQAQTTAGIAMTVVFPVAAQTSSFASEMTLFNPGPNLLTASVSFYEANNAGAPGPKVCNDVSVPAGRSTQITLSTQCALTGSGGHFGLLIVADKAVPQVNAFYGYTRVQNPQGIGFSVEGFPVTDFSNQVSHATGLKRKAAAPTYQTNCFVGSLDQPVSYQLKLFNDSTGTQVGGTLVGSLTAFQQFRYLDVFGVNGVNAPTGDLSNIRAEFTQTSGGTANLIGFCTVQDNTSFGADFRIAKSYGSPSSSFFAQGGNSFGTTAKLGTLDNQSLDLYVNNLRVVRYIPNATSPNIVAGEGNAVNIAYSGQTIAGGGYEGNCTDPTVLGGLRPCGNRTANDFATINGGFANQAAGPAATIAGGAQNTASADSASVGGGVDNIASGTNSTVAGGFGNSASGIAATAAGGYGNTASGNYSFVAGLHATAKEDGMFVWSDATGWAFDPTQLRAAGQSAGTFNVRATGIGGVLFVTGINPSTGATTSVCYTQNLSGWTCTSDRNVKRNLRPVDSASVLEKVVAMPVYHWQPKDGPNRDVEHLGPMAQDFMAAFRLGDNDKAIGFQDEEGVALAAIQGLHQLVQAKDEKIEAQQREITALKARMANVELMLAALHSGAAPIAGFESGRR